MLMNKLMNKLVSKLSNKLTHKLISAFADKVTGGAPAPPGPPDFRLSEN